MTLDQFLTSLVYLGSVLVLFVIGKFVFDLLHPRFKLKEELVEKDNFAMAVTLAGYMLGLVFAIGGIMSGESNGIVNDLFDIFFFGLFAVVLLNVAGVINDKVMLYKFDNVKEIIDDRNAGTGAIVGGNYMAVGLIFAGAFSGQDGDLITGCAFWLLGQVVLILCSKIYNLSVKFDLHDEVERDNVAVGVAFAGILIATGNILRIGTSGDFESWQENLVGFAAYSALGLVILPLLRIATDRLLLPGARLTDELVNQEKPNVGAGLIEATSYVCASLLIAWIL
ncbi:DUF350 domain-containing protein [Acanthopleuribacter pedis]|uniref:DUF350 domain-containing protein n=1 Tax=Acanthopleuribacter pedis TaxID=442870 RepID=A0A8J7QDM9_9BACT|nr:DUF350 domain-containing protein [Acanthopleuribacter pedis]MBO1322224.1 DUF350 domain-containing protein [Acanthopleuribacter pedis]